MQKRGINQLKMWMVSKNELKVEKYDNHLNRSNDTGDVNFDTKRG
jgi:hypothetical protein